MEHDNIKLELPLKDLCFAFPASGMICVESKELLVVASDAGLASCPLQLVANPSDEAETVACVSDPDENNLEYIFVSPHPCHDNVIAAIRDQTGHGTKHELVLLQYDTKSGIFVEISRPWYIQAGAERIVWAPSGNVLCLEYSMPTAENDGSHTAATGVYTISQGHVVPFDIGHLLTDHGKAFPCFTGVGGKEELVLFQQDSYNLESWDLNNPAAETPTFSMSFKTPAVTAKNEAAVKSEEKTSKKNEASDTKEDPEINDIAAEGAEKDKEDEEEMEDAEVCDITVVFGIDVIILDSNCNISVVRRTIAGFQLVQVLRGMFPSEEGNTAGEEDPILVVCPVSSDTVCLGLSNCSVVYLLQRDVKDLHWAKTSQVSIPFHFSLSLIVPNPMTSESQLLLIAADCAENDDEDSAAIFPLTISKTQK